MISAIKKKFSTPTHQNNVTKTKQGINIVNADLQRKFANGVNFNMKIVIRGDRNTGKTCLFKRLQGHNFIEEYSPTDEIQVSNITWSYRTSDFIVKVDVWDVVDESTRRKPKSDGLKLDNAPRAVVENGPEDMMVCDATFVDVYKNCNGVLLIFDVTKAWTWKYVQTELSKIPSTIPVLVMANKHDLEEKSEVREEECIKFLNNFQRPPTLPGKLEAPIRYTQASMKNANGLRYLYNFLNIPFLFVQRDQLENTLEVNKHDIQVANYELDQFKGSPNSPPPSILHRPQPTVSNPIREVNQEQNESSFSTPQMVKKNTASSESGDDNQMVDLYEEDFDSNDEYHRTLDQFVVKSSTTSNSISPHQKSPETDPEIIREEIKLEEETPVIETLDLSEFSHQVQSDLVISKTPTVENLDDWLETPTTPEAVELKGKKVEERDDSSSEEDNFNPLVSKIEDKSSDEDVVIEVKRNTRPQTLSNLNNNRSQLEEFLSEDSKSDVSTKKKVKKVKNGDKTEKTKPKKKKKVKETNILQEDNLGGVGNGDYDPL